MKVKKERFLSLNMRSKWDDKPGDEGNVASNLKKLLEDDEVNVPSIVCLQDVASKQWYSCVPSKGTKEKAVKKMLGEVTQDLGYKAIFSRAKGYAERCEYIGMLYKPEKFHLVRYGILDAYDTVGRHVCARQPFLAVFRRKLADGTLGQPFVVVTFHLTCTYRATANEVTWLNAMLRALKIPAAVLIFVAGDSNVGQDSEQWKHFHVEYMHLVPNHGSTMFSGVGKDKGFDSVLMRPEQKRQYQASTVVLDHDKWKMNQNDDHCPVLTTLDFSQVSSESEEAVEAFLKHLEGLCCDRHDNVGDSSVFRLEGIVKPILPSTSSYQQSPVKRSLMKTRTKL